MEGAITVLHNRLFDHVLQPTHACTSDMLVGEKAAAIVRIARMKVDPHGRRESCSYCSHCSHEGRSSWTEKKLQLLFALFA